MGLASDLEYAIGDKSSVRRAMAAIGSTRPVSAISNKIIRPIDRLVLRLTEGRTTATSWLIGIPPLWLTTTGARSGQARAVPLFGIPIADDLSLLGTSFAKRATPDWVHNLEAEPRALVSYRDVKVMVRARLATEEEETAIWARAAAIYPGYARYKERAAHRRIRVFVLESHEVGSARGRVGS